MLSILPDIVPEQPIGYQEMKTLIYEVNNFTKRSQIEEKRNDVIYIARTHFIYQGKELIADGIKVGKGEILTPVMRGRNEGHCGSFKIYGYLQVERPERGVRALLTVEQFCQNVLSEYKMMDCQENQQEMYDIDAKEAFDLLVERLPARWILKASCI